MQLKLGAWPVPALRGRTKLPFATVAEVVLVLAIAGASVALLWALLRPLGPVGRWQAVRGTPVISDPSLLTRFDPFFRNAGAGGPSAVTSLPLKLFGIRLDQAMGRGSAIIATPEGVQSSYAVGDEIVPGVKLKSVAFDHITLERGLGARAGKDVFVVGFDGTADGMTAIKAGTMYASIAQQPEKLGRSAVEAALALIKKTKVEQTVNVPVVVVTKETL